MPPYLFICLPNLEVLVHCTCAHAVTLLGCSAHWWYRSPCLIGWNHAHDSVHDCNSSINMFNTLMTARLGSLTTNRICILSDHDIIRGRPRAPQLLVSGFTVYISPFVSLFSHSNTTSCTSFGKSSQLIRKPKSPEPQRDPSPDSPGPKPSIFNHHLMRKWWVWSWAALILNFHTMGFFC